MRISINQRSFEKNGQPFFYLADTCWSAFTNITDTDWLYYLKHRKLQGFNVLQINILPQWDASVFEGRIMPYSLNEQGGFDYSKINLAYFEHAQSMVEIATTMGFEVALVILWCNYVPSTWASQMSDVNIMPKEYIREYVQLVDQYFSKFDPMYVISGDTDFNEVSTEYYEIAMDEICRLSPKTLKTTHIKGRYLQIPNSLVNKMDFYMYQSGHNAEPQNANMPYFQAEHFYKNYPVKPLINSEPCYEQMGFSRGLFGKWSQDDVRKAAYQSVLSGAFAGITYGAAGVYQWHTPDSYFDELMGEGFARCEDWMKALHYPGAWDYGWLKEHMESMSFETMVPEYHLVSNEQIRVSSVNDKEMILIYSPVPTQIKLNERFDGYSVKAYDLKNRQVMQLPYSTSKDQTHIDASSCAKDVLVVMSR